MKIPVLIVANEMPVAMDLANTLEKFNCDLIATLTHTKDAYAQAITQSSAYRITPRCRLSFKNIMFFYKLQRCCNASLL
jgi:hypothetical protein